MPPAIRSCSSCHSLFISSHSVFAASRSPRSIASIARSIVGRDISSSSSVGEPAFRHLASSSSYGVTELVTEKTGFLRTP